MARVRLRAEESLMTEPTLPGTGKYVRVRDVAEYFGVRPLTVHTWIKKGFLGSLRAANGWKGQIYIKRSDVGRFERKFFNPGIHLAWNPLETSTKLAEFEERKRERTS